MGTALLIGITGMLGCIALGLGVFVLGTPLLARPAEKQGCVSPPGSLVQVWVRARAVGRFNPSE